MNATLTSTGLERGMRIPSADNSAFSTRNVHQLEIHDAWKMCRWLSIFGICSASFERTQASTGKSCYIILNAMLNCNAHGFSHKNLFRNNKQWWKKLNNSPLLLTKTRRCHHQLQNRMHCHWSLPMNLTTMKQKKFLWYSFCYIASFLCKCKWQFFELAIIR